MTSSVTRSHAQQVMTLLALAAAAGISGWALLMILGQFWWLISILRWM